MGTLQTNYDWIENQLVHIVTDTDHILYIPMKSKTNDETLKIKPKQSK